MSHIETISKHPKYESIPGYWERHERALRAPQGQESPFVTMLRGWLSYADEHVRAYESKVGEDGFLGPEWEAIGKALLALLNGVLGRLDCGALDAVIRDALRQEGFDNE